MDKKLGLDLRHIALFGMLGAVTFGAKVAMSALPNIEPVSLMVMVFMAVFGWKGLYPVYVYVTMELLFYGLGLWNINYLYIWAVLALGSIAIRKLRNPIFWALLSGLFGMGFGLLCTPVYAVTFGRFDYALRWWLAGIPFDIPHAIGNFVIGLVLFAPLRKLMEICYKKKIIG